MENRLRDGWVEAAATPDVKTATDRINFIRSHTEVLSPPLVPEIRLHLAHEAVPLWQKTEEELGEMGLPPPFWAFAWAGGQALARFVLDHPEHVKGRQVIDLASGSGLVAIAAMQAGAASVLAADIDEYSGAAIVLNAKLNGVELTATTDDLLLSRATDCNVILVGDLFYERAIAARLYEWLAEARGRLIASLVGDPGRNYLPREKLKKLADYNVPVTRDLEDAEIKKTSVWQLA